MKAENSDLRIETTELVCPKCEDTAKDGLTTIYDSQEILFEGCRYCFLRMLDENPIAKVIWQNFEREQEEKLKCYGHLGALCEYLEHNVPPQLYGRTKPAAHLESDRVCYAAILALSKLQSELELYETEGTEGIKHQRDFLLEKLKSARLEDLRGILELAIECFPDKYQNRIAKANGRLADLIYTKKEMRKEVRSPGKDRVWKHGL